MTNGDMADRARDEVAATEAQEAYDKVERQVWSGSYPWGPPSRKDQAIEDLVAALAEAIDTRVKAISGGTCIDCQKPINSFRDQLSQKEYTISGLCQECQDEVFG